MTKKKSKKRAKKSSAEPVSTFRFDGRFMTLGRGWSNDQGAYDGQIVVLKG